MLSINKNLLPVKSHFFLYTGLETLRKMLPLLYRENGVSSEVVGVVYSTMTLIGLLFTFVGGAVADYFKVQRMMLILLILVATIGTSAIYFLPEIPHSAPILAEEAGRVERSMQNSLEVEGHGILESGEMNPNSSVLIETTSKGLAELLVTPTFLLLVICHAADHVPTGLVSSLADTLAFRVLDGDSTKYGQQKMFTSIGLMLNAAISGYLVDWYSQGQPKKDLLPAFAICLALCVLDISVLCKMKLPESKKIEKGGKGNFFEFLNFKVLLYLITVFVLGFSMNLMWVFKPLVAEDVTHLYDPNFGYHKLLQGLMISMQNASGTLFYFLSGFFIRKLGHTRVFIIGLFSLGLHFVIYYLISNPWYILPLELVHGPSYALLYATAASYAAKVAPPNAVGTLQAVQQFAFFFGYVVAGFAGGYVFNSFGGAMTFLLSGCFVFAFALFYALCKTILKLQDKLANKATEVSKQVHQSDNLYPTPPPSPVANKSFHLASLDSTFMEDFKEIRYTPNIPDIKSELQRKQSFTSCDSGCYDMEINSAVKEFGVRSLTPRVNATPKVSEMEGASPSQSLLNSTFIVIESVKKSVTLSPSFRGKGPKSSSGRSKRELLFWVSPRIPSEKVD